MIQNIIKRKNDRLYIKQKGYDNSFNSLSNMQDMQGVLKKVTHKESHIHSVFYHNLI